jgi:fructose/tagatose bisphosphate aldolase
MHRLRLFNYGGVLCVRVGDLVKYKNGVENFSGIVVEVLNTRKVNVCFHWDNALYTNTCDISDLALLSSIESGDQQNRDRPSV